MCASNRASQYASCLGSIISYETSIRWDFESHVPPTPPPLHFMQRTFWKHLLTQYEAFVSRCWLFSPEYYLPVREKDVGCSILHFHPSPQIITTKIQVWSYREPLYSTPLLFIWQNLRVVIFRALTAHQTPTVRAKNFRNWLKIFGALTSANLYIYIPFNP